MKPLHRHLRIDRAALLLIISAVVPGFAASRLPAAEPLRTQIDRLVALQTSGYEQLAAPLATDEEFLRRVYLDLAGTIPPIAETRAFLADADAQKREKLVDRLLAGAEYPRHLQRQFDVMLMQNLPQKHVDVAEWQKFLREAFAQNRPWDQVVREMLSSDGSEAASRGAARFYLDREGDVHRITRDIGRLFLGVNLECAQCHDHPQIDDYHQRHYYGIAAFFVRSFVMTDKEKRVVFAEKADGEAVFESVFEVRDKISKGPQQSGMRFFDALPISEPKFDKVEEAYLVQPDKKDKAVRPVPRFSRRAKFAEWVASADNRRFCRTTANRLWAMLLGVGLVSPVDLDHGDNPPSHPLLLALLTEELAARQLDLKSLIREIVLSQTYQRSSRLTDGQVVQSQNDRQFVVASIKPLSPAQLAHAVLRATGETEIQARALGDKLTADALDAALAQYEKRFTKLFAGEPGQASTSFEPTTDQALFLANDKTIAGLLVPKPGNLAERLRQFAPGDTAGLAEELYLSTLIRRPASEDVADVEAYLADRTGEARAQAIGELIWSTLASSEFRFNH